MSHSTAEFYFHDFIAALLNCRYMYLQVVHDHIKVYTICISYTVEYQSELPRISSQLSFVQTLLHIKLINFVKVCILIYLL
jgi:hypothetical protein